VKLLADLATGSLALWFHFEAPKLPGFYPKAAASGLNRCRDTNKKRVQRKLPKWGFQYHLRVSTVTVYVTTYSLTQAGTA
jgi:hypothetical protein